MKSKTGTRPRRLPQCAERSSDPSAIIELVTPGSAYDTIGRGYGDVRRPDPRIASAIWFALGGASSVVNVGAGTGSYEPRDRTVVAIEPSAVMIAQRPPDAAPAIHAVAEALPLGAQAVDAAMAVLSMQHWEDVEQGVREPLRVARGRVVLVTMDIEVLGRLWLVRDYLPETLVDPGIRAASSPWHQLASETVSRALDSLERDLISGGWDHRYGALRRLRELDVGLRLISADMDPSTRGWPSRAGAQPTQPRDQGRYRARHR
jgi:SAM-dependent methyltransferase